MNDPSQNFLRYRFYVLKKIDKTFDKTFCQNYCLVCLSSGSVKKAFHGVLLILTTTTTIYHHHPPLLCTLLTISTAIVQ